MDFSAERALLATLPHWEPRWYQERYPDVAAAGMDPVVHYLRYGALMGRDPGKNFDTRFYLETYPDAAASGLNPLVHFALHGQAAGYATRPKTEDPRKRINVLRTKLLSLGFTEHPLEELTGIATSDAELPEARAMAARELALWYMRAKTAEDYRTALNWIAQARQDAPDLDFRAKLSTVELLCHYHLGDPAAGLAAYDRAALAGEATPDLMLARVNYAQTPERRVLWINQVLARYGIEPVTLLPDEGQPAYDRLTCAVDLPKVTDGPRVTVLIAAYDAAEMLPTALRSLQEQTWTNLEIIVLDDCSPTMDTLRVAERFAATDPRIQVVRMPENGGAYVARNHGLDLATGEFVTIHDADDWSHPRKIETQVRFMIENPEVMGCMTQQARMRPDLECPASVQDGIFIHANTSSLLFRRQPVTDRLGYWDRVRFSADNEFLRRMRHVFGGNSVHQPGGTVLSFQRASAVSIMADSLRGMSDFLFGARREYLDAQNHARPRLASLTYANAADARPFPVPALMLEARPGGWTQADRVLATDFRYPCARLTAALDDLRQWQAQGLTCAVFELNDPGAPPPGEPFRAHMLPTARAFLQDSGIRILTYGDKVSCDRLVIRGDRLWQAHNRYLPTLQAADLQVLSA